MDDLASLLLPIDMDALVDAGLVGSMDMDALVDAGLVGSMDDLLLAIAADRDAIDDPLAAQEEVNEALAVAAHAEAGRDPLAPSGRLHDDARLSNPYDDPCDLFGLLDDGAVRVRREGAFAMAERYVDGELVGEGMLVRAEGCWRWVDEGVE